MGNSQRLDSRYFGSNRCGFDDLVGIVGGIARQSLMAFAMGIGGGMGLYNSPTVVESIMSATLENAEKVIPTVVQLSNGLGL
jgi:conjugal transfer pilus assembly protein TraA